MKKGTVLVAAMLLSGAMTVPAYAGVWRPSDNGTWYENDDGTYPASAWQEIDNKWYYFDSNGYMLRNTTTPDGYHVNDDGVWEEGSAAENATEAIQETQAAETQAETQPETQPETVNIEIPEPTGYGTVKGNITWQYNKFIGTRPDTGANVFLVPLDYNIKGGGNEDFAMTKDPKGHNNVYRVEVDGMGQYCFDNIPSGNYRIVVISWKTTSGFRFKDEYGWRQMVHKYVWKFFTPDEFLTFADMVGYKNITCEDIKIENGQTTTYSHDFGYTYI